MVAPIQLNRFDLVSLRLFVAIIEGGSLTRGAERFGISVAAASKRIAELEAHIGSALLKRSKRGVEPTATGQTLLRRAIEIVASLEQLSLAMADYRRGAGGHLRLWANTSAFTGFLPKLLAEYSATYPTVMLDLEDAVSEDAVRAVARGFDEVCRMIAVGLGIGILPRASVAPHVKSMGLRVAKLSGLQTERRLLLVMRDRETLTEPAIGFVRLAEERIRQ
jgi:DNA-binding transcriptional LysR family regulator